MKTKLIFMAILAMLIGCHGKSDADKPRSEEVVTLTAKALITPLFYSGTIQPLKTKVITSPADGVIYEMLFHYGDQVKAGDKLFTIASEKFQTDYIAALMQYIKAKNEFNTNHSQLMQSEFLHKNKLISDDEYKTKKSGFYNAQLALLQAKETLKNLIKQLTVQGLKMEDLTIENINKITEALHAQGDSQKLRITAPSGGVILLPAKTEGESDTKKVGKGDQVKQGDLLAVVGDTSGLIVRVNVNEFNINQIKVGQKVKVTGAAFPDITLAGYISGIDRQAQSNSNGMPTFPIEIIVPKLNPKEQAIIHIGMSAKVEIKIGGEPQLVVPIKAIVEKDGKTFVRVKDDRGRLREAEVITGQTTLDSVVIESTDLKTGENIVFTR